MGGSERVSVLKAEMLQSILAAAKDAILVIDVEGKVSYLNGAAEEMFGYPRGEMMGENLHEMLVPESYRPAFIEGFRRFRETGEGPAIGETLELTALRRDGSEFPVELSLSATRVGDGWHAVGVIRDISERREGDEAQRKINWALGERVKELNCLYGIGELVEQPGISLDAIFQGAVNLIPPAWQHPDVACARLALGDDAFTSENFRESEWRQSSDVVVHGVKEGVLDVFYLEEMPEFDEGPFLMEERSLIHEISDRLGRVIERREAEEALRRSEEQYRRLWEESGDGLVMVSPEDGGIVDCNEEYMRQTGRSREELLSMKIWELRPPLEREGARRRFFEVRDEGSGASLELAYVRPNGGVTHVDLLAEDIWIGERRLVQVRTRDISRWVELRGELEASEARWRSLVEMAPVGIFTVDLKGVITSGNPVMAEMTGRGVEEMVGRHFTRLGVLKARDIPGYMEAFASVLRGEVPDPFDTEIVHRDGSRRDVEAHLGFVDAEDIKSGLQVVVVDVTERRHHQAEAEEARERLEVLMENAPDAIYLNDTRGTFIDGNRAAEELTGYSREELIGKNFLKLSLLPVGQIPQAAKLLALNRMGRRTGPVGLTLNRKGGGQVEVEVTSYPVRLGEETVVMGIARDVTERREEERRLEGYAVNLEGMVEEKTRELVDAERMTAAGRVAAMLGHDLRGPLQAISNAAYLIRKSPGDAEASLGIIEGSVARAAGMLEEFRLSTRDSPPVMIPVDLGALVAAAVGEAGAPEGVDVSVEAGEGLGAVTLDPGMIRRVMDNLVRNALDAMPRGGGLWVSAERVGGDAVVVVRDSGEGIPDAVMGNLFKAFNTSKAGGLGLGLAYCRRAVEGHGGGIGVESEVGVGTTFTVTLPVEPM